MKKSEIFNIIIDKVCEVCEVSKSSIIEGLRHQSVVDARALCVQYMRRAGLSNDDISLLVMRAISGNNDYTPSIKDIKVKSKTVDKIFKSYSDRCLWSYAFCMMSREINDFLRERYSEYYSRGMKELPTK